MIWKIAKKEFLLNLMTFKFAVGTIVCVILTAVFVPVLVNDYQQRLKDYDENVAANEAELRKVKIYKNITPTLYRPPNQLSVFSAGVDKQMSNSAKIKLGNVPDIKIGFTDANPLLSIFPVLDVSLIFKIVISILAMLMAYDVISGDREQGTLKLILSGTVARYQVLAGKFMAGLMSLVVPLTIAFIVGLLILEFSPMVDLSRSDWVRIGLMYLASLIFISAMYNLGLLISCLTKRSTISLMFGLFFWVVFVILIPNGSVYLASQLRPIESPEKFDAEVKTLVEKREGEISELKKTLKGGGSQSKALGAFGQMYVLICNKGFMERRQKELAFTEPLQIKYADKVFKVHQRYLNNLMQQKYLADGIARISPVILYENLMSALSGADLGSFEYFTDTVKAYRNQVIEYIRSKTENFSSPSYFTTSKEEDWNELAKMYLPCMQAQTEGERMKAMETFKKWYDQKAEETPSIGLVDFPKFTYQREGVVKGLQRVFLDSPLLIFANVLFFALSSVAFLRYDVR